MRIATEANVLETGGAQSARRSTIKTSKKTFRMVIDGIYSNKFESIVREITANAFDSHRRAQQDRPFFVHCPTMLKPEFFVRDFGTGMTDQIMEDVYIVVGESDKDMTDDEVGMWGLGSKSPFAYADQYNITCYDGEIARFYGFGIDEDGVPTLYLMHSEASDEPRGVQIGFAVEAKDFAAFEKAIQNTSVAHAGNFESNIALKQIGEIVFSGEGWQCYKGTEIDRQGTNWFARQGCVLYPIARNQVETPQEYNTTHVYILDCPIGTVQVTTSREAISYEEKVVAYLKARVEQVKEEIAAAVWEAVKDIEDVVKFFETITRIKPTFLSSTFTHPVTGLTEAAVKAGWPNLFFETKFTAQGRWEFATPASLTLAGFKRAEIIVLDDMSSLLDPSRDGETDGRTGWVSKSEMRRISRFTRAYLEGIKATDALFLMNVDWSDEFWKACFPNTTITKITFDELRRAVPKRVTPPKMEAKPPIRGLALAKSAGEQKPVFEVKAPQPGEPLVAWVSSEQYKRQASALFKMARRFDISALYIAAPGVQVQLTDVGIVHMREALDAALAKKGVSLADWFFTKDRLNDYVVKNYILYLRTLGKVAPKAYTLIAKGKGEFSVIAKSIKRLLKADVTELTDDEKKAVDVLFTDEDGKSIKPPLPADMVGFDTAVKAIKDQHYYNPTCKFATSLETVKSEDQLVRAAEALLALQAIISPSEKFRG